MGTSNFLYAKETGLNVVNLGECGNEEFACQYFKSVFKDDLRGGYLAEYIKKQDKINWKKHGISFEFEVYEKDEYDNERNFCGLEVGMLMLKTNFCDADIEVKVPIILRSGYYEGINIDSFIELEVYEYCILEDHETLLSVPKEVAEEILDSLVYADIISQGMAKMQIDNLTKKIGLMEKLATEAFGYIVKDYCEEYRVLTQFSNGETWYEKVA